MKLERNDKCPCGSGQKYKKCCYLVTKKNRDIERVESRAKNWDDLVRILSAPKKVYKLKVVLIRMGHRQLSKEVSRTIEVEDISSLHQLHSEIQRAFNWDNDHLYSFYFGGKLFDRANEYHGNPLGDGEVSETQIQDFGLSEKTSFLYLFDFGDELVHEIEVVEIRDKYDSDKKFPVTVSKSGAAPEQYEEW